MSYYRPIAVAALFFFCACGPDDPYVGHMDDTSYAGQVTPAKTIGRVNAKGQIISIDQFRGRFVWAEYSAPWCSPCIPQARAIRQLDQRYRDKVIFLTVITSASTNYGDVPTQETARAWAAKTRLNPDRVVAATNLYGRKIPSHILYSPEGHALFRHEGLLSAAYIRKILERRMAEWYEWSRNGVTADWMR